MDTRAFRLPLPAGTMIYEVDDQAVLAGKQVILDREHAVPNSTRQPVAADLTGARWPGSLAATGFSPTAPAVFEAEGLTVYLPEDAVAPLQDRTADIAAPGSRLGIDIASADYLANPAAAPFSRLAAARGTRWQFGTNDPGGFLAAHGWQADIHDMFAVTRSLGRWPPPGVPDDPSSQ
jgi:methyltransferase (TIGR00027 family)